MSYLTIGSHFIYPFTPPRLPDRTAAIVATTVTSSGEGARRRSELVDEGDLVRVRWSLQIWSAVAYLEFEQDGGSSTEVASDEEEDGEARRRWSEIRVHCGASGEERRSEEGRRAG